MANGSFAVNVQKFAEKAKLAPSLVMRKAALDMFSMIVKRSPVDTGAFRANWHISLGAPEDKIIAARDTTGKASASKGVTFGTMHKNKSGTATINAALPSVAAITGDEKIYILNNLPYAIPLEYGSSKQAPAGVVRVSAKEFVEYLQKALKAVR